MSAVLFISQQDIRLILARHPEFGGVIKPNEFSACFERPFSGSFGVEFFPTLFDKCAAMYEAISRYHTLGDGNKRFAWLCLCVVLAKNGYKFKKNSTKFYYDFAISVAEGKLTTQEISAFLKANTMKV